MGNKKLVIGGIDEAGRGPVIGPMVIAGVTIHPEDEKALKELGVKDSKDLTPRRREELYDEIEKIAKDIIILKVEACKIDSYKKEGINLNRLELLKFAEITNFLKPDGMYIDSPEADTEKLRKILEKMVESKTELILENKADSKYLVVGAASILAKVTRDREIKDLSRKYGKIGSGYPSDPITMAWLRGFYERERKFPDCTRMSWQTVQNIEKELGQSRLGKWFKSKK